jgi:hypothetical protein
MMSCKKGARVMDCVEVETGIAAQRHRLDDGDVVYHDIAIINGLHEELIVEVSCSCESPIEYPDMQDKQLWKVGPLRVSACGWRRIREPIGRANVAHNGGTAANKRQRVVVTVTAKADYCKKETKEVRLSVTVP